WKIPVQSPQNQIIRIHFTGNDLPGFVALGAHFVFPNGNRKLPRAGTVTALFFYSSPRYFR
ncbi:MAG TPA: hypothetical protein VK399_15870, partial [Longimicrobiaceae bacterium]|nr:hypothetical protein [Longimicrobiaceae bacterium]